MMVLKTTDVKTYMDDFAQHAVSLGLDVTGHDYGDSMVELNLPTETYTYSTRTARYYEDEQSSSIIYGPYITTPAFSCYALDGNEDKIIIEWLIGETGQVLSMTLAEFKQCTYDDVVNIVEDIILTSFENKRIAARLVSNQRAVRTTINHRLKRLPQTS